MWSDVIQRGEQLYYLRVFFWGALSSVLGTALLVFTLTQSRGSPIIRRFAATCAILGAAELLIAIVGYRSVGLRDLSGATRLDRFAWLQLGLCIGIAGMGVAMSLAGRSIAAGAGSSREKTLAFVGAGIAVTLHGLALATLALLLIAAISR
jgi:hypothetical protein